MKDWIVHQIMDINIIAIIIIFTFVTAMSKMNTQKLLKEQSQEIYNQVEQIKEEIWRARGE
jgi:large-conductance mechanosensitive channel